MKSGTVTPKPVIVAISYGTLDPAGEKEQEKIDRIIRERFPDNEVRWVYAAGHFLQALKKMGRTTIFERKVPIKSLEEMYSDLVKEGKTNVALLCLLVHESWSVSKWVYEHPTQGLNVKYTKPLLADIFNVEKVVEALAPQFGGEDTVTILVGHGGVSGKEFHVNAPFWAMDEYISWRYKNVFVATVHGPPGVERAIADAQKTGCSQVLFIPLFLTTGEHITKDVMADTPESWKSRVGLPARVGSPFCDDPLVMEVYVSYLASVLSQF